MSELLKHAQCYAAAGLEVFPVDPATKTPISAGARRNDGPGNRKPPSQADATCDEQKIELWWTIWPDALIGHRLAEDVMILDVDPRYEGNRTWKAFRKAHDLPAPSTRTHLSGRGDGGGHLWFRRPTDQRLTISKFDTWAQEHEGGKPVLHADGTETGKWVCGIDILQRNHRYSILPPSPHPATGDPYYWHHGVDSDIESMPAPLLEILVDTRPPSKPFVPKPYDGDDINEWYNQTHSVDEILARNGWNQRKNGAWQHPTATNQQSASTRHNCLFVYSPNTPFDVTYEGDPHGHKPIAVFALLEHGGDFSAAASAARAEKDQREAFGAAAADEEGHTLNLPDSFWTSRGVFAAIRDAAHNRCVSADAVFSVVLARFAANIPHNWDLPITIGKAGSLNFASTIVGPSGAGKSSAIGVATELVPLAGNANLKVDGDMLPVGSGEGIAEAFIGEVEETGDDGKKRKRRGQVRHNVFIVADEGSVLSEMASRQGSTILSYLRTAWTGGDLGQQNATAERRRIIKSGMYRLGMIVGIQPAMAGALFSDEQLNAGSSQRLFTLSAIDPNIPEWNDRPAWPGTMSLDPPAVPPPSHIVEPGKAGGFRRARLTATEDILREVGDAHHRTVTGKETRDPIDSHANYHRMKMAGLFALLEGRFDINAEDWELATVVWDTSCRVRQWMVDTVKAQRDREEQSRTHMFARREAHLAAARTTAGHDITRVANRIMTIADNAEDGFVNKGDINRGINSRDRHLVPAALSQLLGGGHLREDVDGRYEPVQHQSEAS